MKQSFVILLTDERVAFLKARFGVETNAEVRKKLQRIAEGLIAKQFISPVDKEFRKEE